MPTVTEVNLARETHAQVLDDAERSVISSMMNDTTTSDIARSQLDESDFYDRKMAHLFSLILDRCDQGLQCDILSLKDILNADGVLPNYGGFDGLLALYQKAEYTNLLPGYCDIVHRESRRRQQLRAYYEAIHDTENALSEEELEIGMYKAITALESKKVKAKAKDYQIGKIAIRLYEEAADRAEQKKENPKKVFGVQTPFTQLNKITGGLQKGNLLLVAARPSVGKTSVSLQCALRAGLDGRHVAFISLEMSEDELTDRCISNIAMVESSRVRASEVLEEDEWSRWERADAKFEKMRIHFFTQRPLRVSEIASKLREWKRLHGDIDLIIVDYLQLISPERGVGRQQNRNNEVGNIVKALKDIAMEHRAPMMLLSQLNREVDKRPGNRPVLADLRDSGEIEAEADLVIFPDRPAARDPKHDTVASAYQEQQGVLIVAKYRNGLTCDIPIAFVPAFGRWSDWNDIGALGDQHAPPEHKFVMGRDESDERF